MVDEWNRDHAPSRMCACGHADTEHDMTDPKGRPKKVQRCGYHSGEAGVPCSCAGYDLTHFLWREHRTVVEVWKP